MSAILKLVLTCLLLASLPRLNAAGQTNPFLHTVAADGTAHFELTERIKHPHFWWPRTLLNYRVIFTAPPPPANQWGLTDEATGKDAPLQVSDVRRENGKIVAATVSFFSDLPTGGHRSFVLHTNPQNKRQAAEPSLITQAGSSLVLDMGVLKVRVPNSAEIVPGRTAPGPILAVNDGKGWIGESTIDSPKKQVRKVTTEILDQGPLFARVRVTYDFEGGANYVATIKAPLGYSFVEFTEEFSGLAVEDKAQFHFLWTGLPLTYRAGGEPIDQPHIIYYRGEDPHFTGPDHVENLAEEFYFRLGHAAADNTTFRTAVDFSNPNTGRAIGLCVLDGSKWDDGEYSIWAASDTLCVKFRYQDTKLEWLLPLAGKSRQLAFAAYDLKDSTNAERLARFAGGDETPAVQISIANRGVANGQDLTSFINSRYGGMSLDVVKEWQLAYPEKGGRSGAVELPPNERYKKNLANLDAYIKAIWGDHEALHVEGNWFSPVALRQIHQWIVPGFNKFRDAMTPEIRERVTALLLFQSYLAAREEISPIQHMLKGHPNFMADWKYPLLAGAWLFPDHPMAREWADQWEKFVELAGIFYVRPEVKSWEAKGGRWTENLGTYNWAFIEPATQANELGLLYDGRDRLASAGQALHGNYLSGTVTVPVKIGKDGSPFDFTPGQALLPENGFQRIHPPQGAHSTRRPVPGCIESFANSFRNFDPVTAEHMLWINRRPEGSATGFESDSAPPATARALTQGTNPRLRSAKYTGYGIVLRSAVDTTNEISVFLQQVDKGPNYRWGFGNENGGGDIYYYAAGNSYSGHLVEDAGDRHLTDTEVTCNTGVYKDSTFRGIGMNDLTEPLYDLGSAQFAEILARSGPDAYSWPEYEARSVMLVGHDYIITYDTLNNPSRVSWNTLKGQDKMPNILPIRGDVNYRTTQTSVVAGHENIVADGMRLEGYKNVGDRMILVSHRTDLKVTPAKKNSDSPVSEVITPEGRDFIFQQRATFHADEKGLVFSGRAGVIRQFKDGRTELNLFKGEQIGNPSLQLAVDNPSLGISATFKTSAEVSGQFFSREGGKLTLKFPGGVPPGGHLFVNGKPAKVIADNNTLMTQLPAGEGAWQLTAGLAVPMSPEITRSVARADGAVMDFTPVASANGYRIELSHDGGNTWTTAGTAKTPAFTLTGLKAPDKVHLRVIALNGELASLPGKEYPVYVTGRPAGPPAGLRLSLAKDAASLTWGRVLGSKEYVVYRRTTGQTDWKEIHRGTGNNFCDRVKGVIPPASDPGLEAAARQQPADKTITYEYAVTAVDDVGESTKSSVTTTDPTSWRNWYPDTPLHYKRRSAYWLPPYVTPEQVPPAAYPE